MNLSLCCLLRASSSISAGSSAGGAGGFSAYKTLPQRLVLGGGEEVSSSSEMCSLKRGERDVLRGAMGVLSRRGTGSEAGGETVWCWVGR